MEERKQNNEEKNNKITGMKLKDDTCKIYVTKNHNYLTMRMIREMMDRRESEKRRVGPNNKKGEGGIRKSRT